MKKIQTPQAKARKTSQQAPKTSKPTVSLGPVRNWVKKIPPEVLHAIGLVQHIVALIFYLSHGI